MCLQLTLKFVDRFITVQVALIIAVVCLTIGKTHKRTQIFFSTIQFQELKLCYGKTITFSHNIPRSVVVKANGMMVLWHMCQNERKHFSFTSDISFCSFLHRKRLHLTEHGRVIKKGHKVTVVENLTNEY